jgi:hypothetical protein
MGRPAAGPNFTRARVASFRETTPDGVVYFFIICCMNSGSLVGGTMFFIRR